MAPEEKEKVAASYGNEWVQTLKNTEQGRIMWLWDGLIAERAITLLSAPEKTGKTTLLSLLLDRRREGGQLLGRMVRPGKTILCSEEDPLLWSLRQPPLDFGPHVTYCQPCSDDITPAGWRSYIDQLLDLQEDAFDLLVIDTIMSFLPAAQNNPGSLRNALNELRLIADLPAAVLLVHQMCTARTRVRARGPLTAFADILIDMQIPHGDRLSRRRYFQGIGRYPGTLRSVEAELNPEGIDYVLLAGHPGTAAQPLSLEIVRELLSQSGKPLTRLEIIARWPPSQPAPHADSLWRTLTRGCETGILIRRGEGTRAEAYRYGLAEGAND
jgi:hypothetical protein